MRALNITIAIALLLLSFAASAQPTFTVIAREGQPAPDTRALYGKLQTPVLNPAGQVAFNALLTGPTATPDNGAGLFLGSPGSVHLLVRNSDPVPGAPPGTTFKDILYPPEIPNLNA